jgi:hypothetical protein
MVKTFVSLLSGHASYINHIRCNDSAASIQAMQWTRQETFLFFKAPILPLGYNQPPIKWVMKTLLPLILVRTQIMISSVEKEVNL